MLEGVIAANAELSVVHQPAKRNRDVKRQAVYGADGLWGHVDKTFLLIA